MQRTAEKSVRVRFAPSPTGHLHVGSLRTALFNYLFARHHDGIFLMRIEDSDVERSKKEYTQSIIDSLAWLNLMPDEPAMIQSERKKTHQQLIAQLVDEGKSYRCYCSQEELVARAGDNAFVVYDGHCRTNTTLQNKPFVVRFKIPDIPSIMFDDLIRGSITFERDQLHDFIISRSDGNPMYNFVVAVDDHAMGITHIIRGEDHISNTPKQILIYQALGYPIPEFAHIPLIMGPSGDRLSKRDGAVSVLEYKNDGYLPEALINYIVRLGWAHGDQEIFTREQLIAAFSLPAVGKKSAIFDFAKLQWLNGVYLRDIPTNELLTYIYNVYELPRSTFEQWNADQLNHAIDCYKSRVTTIKELIAAMTVLYQGPTSYNEDDMKTHITKQSIEIMKDVMHVLKNTLYTKDALSVALKQLLKDRGAKFVALAQPLRIALIGTTSGPGVYDMLLLLSKEEGIKRIHRLYEHTQTMR